VTDKDPGQEPPAAPRRPSPESTPGQELATPGTPQPLLVDSKLKRHKSWTRWQFKVPIFCLVVTWFSAWGLHPSIVKVWELIGGGEPLLLGAMLLLGVAAEIECDETLPPDQKERVFGERRQEGYLWGSATLAIYFVVRLIYLHYKQVELTDPNAVLAQHLCGISSVIGGVVSGLVAKQLNYKVMYETVVCLTGLDLHGRAIPPPPGIAARPEARAPGDAQPSDGGPAEGKP
jgi:hypothetical protein